MAASTTGTRARRWICEACGLIYDPADGDPDSGIAPGTPFEAIPGDWECPVCGARKADFVPYDD
jgi:rubredoxin